MKNRRSYLLPALALACTSPFATAAQSAPQTQVAPVTRQVADNEKIEEIIVTGSRIRRHEFESLQPVVVLDPQQLQLDGTIDLANALYEFPGFSVPAISSAGQSTFDNAGQNYVDFLGLGQQRTLTLVNGRRFPAGGSPTSIGGLSVDISAIPESLVERVEIISVGGAPVYGSDAIAGTVNVILREDFEGIELTSMLGTSPEYHDFDRTRLVATWGRNFGGDATNVTISAQYSNTDGLIWTDRPSTASLAFFEPPGDPDSPYALVFKDDLIVPIDNTTPYPLLFGDQFFLNILGNGVPLDVSDPNSPLAQFDAAGNLVPFVPGQPNGSFAYATGGDGVNLPAYATLYHDMERVNANLFVRHDLSPSLSLDVQAWFARTGGGIITNMPWGNGPLTGGLPLNSYGNVGDGPIPVLINNPFLPEATRASILNALNVFHDFDGDGLADPTIDTDGDGQPDAVGFWRGGGHRAIIGLNGFRTTRDTIYFVAGLEGDRQVGDRDLAWDLYYTYGKSDARIRITDFLQPQFEQAIQVTTDIDGNPVCVDPSGGCVPLNVIGTPSDAAIDFVSDILTDRVDNTQQVISGNTSGDIAGLPAGPLSVAAGFAFREESATFDPDELAKSGIARRSFVENRQRIHGNYTTRELYLETVVPLLGGRLENAFADKLDFEGALRWVDNSVAGTETTWTAGLRYRPVENLEFRGNFTRAIRAPSITEVFTPETIISVFGPDPCDQRFISQGNVPDVRAANCEADGIVQPFNSLISDLPLPGILSGNRNLTSEVANSYAIGLTYRPGFEERLMATVDWVDIRIDNAIESYEDTEILNACYDSLDFPDNDACQRFTRDVDGQISDIRTGFINLAHLDFRGMQTAVSYSHDFDRYGSIDFRLNYFFTDRHTEDAGLGNTVRLDGTIGRSRHRVTLLAGWNRGDWSWQGQFRWLSGAVFDRADNEFTRDIKGVGDWLVVDTNIGYMLTDKIALQLNIDNVFDRDMPYAAKAINRPAFATYLSGVLGRYATLTARASFQ